MEKQRNYVTSDLSDLTGYQYVHLVNEVFLFIEHVSTEIMPLLASRSSSLLQVQVFSLILARQMRGERTYVSQVATELGLPRSSVQQAVDRMIDQNRVSTENDLEDGRRKLLKVDPDMGTEIDALEICLTRFVLDWSKRISRVTGTEHLSDARKEDFALAVDKICRLADGLA